MTDNFCDIRGDEWYDRKSVIMANILGREHDFVMHSMVPYSLGGALDLYYYPNGIPGTAIATKELSEIPGEGATNDVFETYELVMFTRHQLSLDEATDPSTPFGRIHESLSAILNCIARYSEQATLNPHETCEFPEDFDTIGGKCVIFDTYGNDQQMAQFGLLAIIEIHRSELEFSRKHGGANLLEKLRSAGHYPYSDADRPAVV